MSSEIKRYTNAMDQYTLPSIEGEYVRYSDHLAFIHENQVQSWIRESKLSEVHDIRCAAADQRIAELTREIDLQRVGASALKLKCEDALKEQTAETKRKMVVVCEMLDKERELSSQLQAKISKLEFELMSQSKNVDKYLKSSLPKEAVTPLIDALKKYESIAIDKPQGFFTHKTYPAANVLKLFLAKYGDLK